MCWSSLHIYLVDTCAIVAREIRESTSRKRTSLATSSSVQSFHRLHSRPIHVLKIQETDNSITQHRRERSSLVLHLIPCRPLIFVVVVSFKRN